MAGFRNPSRDAIDALLRSIRTVAVVGVSANAFRPSHGVARGLQRFGYRIVPVNPSVEQVLGERCWPSLEAAVRGLGGESPPADTCIDLVDVFRSPEHVPAIVNDCIRLKLRALWLQDGIINEEAATRAQSAGILTVMDRCLYRDRAMLAA